MLGRFLEYSLSAPDIQASIDFYRRLGFSEARVGEAWAHPYAVMTDGRLCLGLHQKLMEPTMTFVKTDLLKHADALESHGVEFEYRRLGNDIFNEIAWRDCDGHLLRLIEARTFSPSEHPAARPSLCGYFREIALPCANFENAKNYWESFGFVGIDALDQRPPHIGCTSDSLDIGLYERDALGDSGLLFETEVLDAAERTLGDLGVRTVRETAALAGTCARFIAPEGTFILMAGVPPTGLQLSA